MRNEAATWDFFLAHAGPDKQSAEAIFDKLSVSARVFLDSRCLKLGDDWDIRLREAQSKSKVTVVLISEKVDAAYYQREEIAAAIALARSGETHRVVPVYLTREAAKSELVPYGLRLKHGVMLSGHLGIDELVVDLLALLDSSLNNTHESQRDSELCRVTIDQSYQQNKWYGDASLEGGYGSFRSLLSDMGKCSVNPIGYQSSRDFAQTDVLVLPTPFRTLVPEPEYREIAKWIQQGGGLLVLGFYLMEAHHYNNLNQLMRMLGAEFCHNLLMPVGRETFQECMAQSFAYQDSSLWIETGLEGTVQNHPILNNVNRIAITSCCSIEYAQTPQLLVHTSEEVLSFHAKGFKDPETGRMVRLTEYVLDRQAPATIMAAFEFGKGRVIGIGSWKVFLDTFLENDTLDNSELLRNCVEWLRGPSN